MASMRHPFHDDGALCANGSRNGQKNLAMFLNLPTVGEPLSNKTQGVHYRPPFASL